MSLGQNNQYYYSPDVTVWIRSAILNNQILDVSEDIMSFTINRQINATSTAQIILANNAFKYTPGSNSNFSKPPLISTMDEIIISLKRETYYQYFTGFVTYSPIVTLIPSPIEIDCSCTLYKAENSYWDAGALQVLNIIPNLLFDNPSSKKNIPTYEDGGVGTGIKNVLTKVCQWNANDIWIGKIPPRWITLATNLWFPIEEAALKNPTVAGGILIQNYIDAAGVRPDTVDGSSTASNKKGTSTIDAGGAPQGTQITNRFGLNAAKADNVSSKDNTIVTQSLGKFWFTYPFGYFVDGKGLTSKQVNQAKDWLRGGGSNPYPSGADINGRLLIVSNTSNGTYVWVNAVAAEPKSQSEDITLSTDAYNALLGTGTGPLAVDIVGWVDPQVTKYKLVGQVIKKANDVTSTPKTKNTVPVNVGVPPALDVKSFTSSSQSKEVQLGTSAVKYAEQLIGCCYPPNDVGRVIVTNNQGLPVIGNTSADCITTLTTSRPDCSLLVYWGWSHAVPGIDIGEDTYVQHLYYQVPNTEPLVAGDLLFQYLGEDGNPNEPGHVIMFVGYTSGGQIEFIQSSETGQKVSLYTCAPSQLGWGYRTRPSLFVTDPSRRGVVGYQSPTAGWSFQANVNQGTITAINSIPKGTSTTVVPTSTNSTAGLEANTPTNDNFNTQLTAPQPDPTSTLLFGTPQAFVTDVQAMSTISTLATAGLRSFQSAPNGDFVAWFPDYFGLYGTAPVLEVRDIEIVDLKIYHDDTQLYTHIGVAGDPTAFGTGVNLLDWLGTTGYVTMSNTSVINLLFAQNPNDTDSLQSILRAHGIDVQQFSNNFLKRYGMRPYVDEEPSIRSTLLEFMYALQEFMYLWAQQYATQCSFTFLPELYPGMIIRLADHDIQMYVQNVVQSGSRDGGFTTNATLTCPTRLINGQPIPIDFGYPISNITLTNNTPTTPAKSPSPKPKRGTPHPVATTPVKKRPPTQSGRRP